MSKPHIDSEGNSQRANQSETVLGASHSGQREARGDGVQVIQVSSTLSPHSKVTEPEFNTSKVSSYCPF